MVSVIYKKPKPTIKSVKRHPIFESDAGLDSISKKELLRVIDELDQTIHNIYAELVDTKTKADEAHEKSFVDYLTGCYNRNYYEKYKNENFDPERDNNRIGLAFFDVNNLKTTNDTLGHAAGDKLIKNTVKYLKSRFRKNDIVVRIGGDEFLVICYNDQDVKQFEKYLQLKVKDRVVAGCPISMAYGVAVFYTSKHKNLDEVKNQAGHLMRACKKQMKAKK